MLAIPLLPRDIEHKILETKTLYSGVEYQYLEMGSRSKKLRVHVAKIEKKNSAISLEPHIISDYAKELGSIIGYDTTNESSLISVNASFFQAGTNLPVGITIIDSEPLQIRKYKHWSSIIFTESQVYFDKIELNASLQFGKNSAEIDRYNYRTDTNQIVAYTSHYTDVFPFISEDDIEDKYFEYLTESENLSVSDSTETLLTQEAFSVRLQESMSDSLTYSYIIAKPVQSAYVNNVKGYIVKNIDKLPVKIGEGELLLELPTQLPLFNGDNIVVKYDTNLNLDEVRHVITTTPLILKNGKEFVNSKYEGATSRRFNYSHLARTAFGYDNKYYYLVAVEPNRGRKVKGATLKEMSWIMETIGATEAINLDGGGSTAFVIDGKNLAIPYDFDYNRKVTTAITVKIK